jgi:glycerate 2-kinase
VTAGTVIVAPDSFKGTYSARAVAEAMRRGLAAHGHSVDVCPVADGGEGTMDVLVGALGGETRTAPALDPLGRPLEARFALLDGGRTGLVETAEASGLALVAPAERAPERASTYGTGQLILAAVEAGATTVLVGVGGTATTDGGAGAIDAIRAGGGLRGSELTVLCDVRTPFEAAAAVFAPQKGADAEAVIRLTARLDEYARALPRDPRGEAMTGAAGGLAGGLWAAFGARLELGAPHILRAVRFPERLARAAAVITGEGRLDGQSTEGKIVGQVARRCARQGVPVYAVVGTDGRDGAGVGDPRFAGVREATTLEAIEQAAGDIGASL